MENLQFILFFLLHWCCFIYAQETVEATEIPESLMDCKNVTGIHFTQYFGWPFRISCKNFNLVYDDNFYGNVSCIVRELPSGNVLYDTTEESNSFEIYDFLNKNTYQFEVTEDTPVDFIVQFQVSEICYYQIVKTVKEKIVEQNCESEPFNKDDAELELGHHHISSCDVPDEYKSDNYTYRWIFDCDENLPHNTESNTLESLDIIDANFSNAGKYLCIVQYKGQEMNAMEHNVCIQYPSSADDKVTVTCQEKQFARINHDVTIQCRADLGIGRANTLIASSKWMPAENTSNILCIGYEGSVTEASDTISCTMNSSLAEEPCYGKIPPDTPPHDIYSIDLTLKNLQRWQLGGITLEFKYSSKRYYRNITLVEDKTHKAGVNAHLLAGVLVLVIVILIAVVLCVWQIHHVRWYWKKYYGPFETDTCTYTSYLAYYYNREISDNSKIELLVTNMHDFIDELGGRLYDEAKDIRLNKYDAQNILQVQKDCHRIIIMLSPDFIKDQWSLKTTYMALNEVVGTGKKVIFIEMPGAKKAMELLESEPRKTLQFAIKHNTTILWSGKEKFSSEFKHRLEYALPKVSTRYGRYLSASSQTYLTHKDNGITANGSLENGFHSI